MAKPLYTPQQIADQLTRNGFHWGDASITYLFPTSGGTATAFGVDNTQKTWIREAIGLVGDVLGLTFTEVASGAASDITFRNQIGGGTYTSWSYYLPSREFAFANIFLDQTWTSNLSVNLSYGSYGFTTILHEFLHAIGLAHPGNYDAGGGPITYAAHAEFAQDTHRYSVMSYFNAHEDGSGTSHYFWNGLTWEWQYPQSPMVYDILALQDGSFGGYFGGYAADGATRNGNTVYGYNATADRDIFDFTVNDAPVLTIYDAGGTDTLDLSGDTATRALRPVYDASGQLTGWQEISSTYVRTIDLREGAYSSTHGLTNNIGIAFGTVIENAVGTNFRDVIRGNSVANMLDGGAGNDTLYGEGGDDRLVGGLGNDVLFGGPGVDTFVFKSGSNWGNDVIEDFEAGIDRFDFQGLDWSAVNFAQAGSDVLITAVGQQGSITVKNTLVGAISQAEGDDFDAPHDFNGDGNSDILWRRSDGYVAMWQMDGSQILLNRAVMSVGTAWEVEGTGDFNGDGNSDILWRRNDGYVSMWQMDGHQILLNRGIMPVGTDWQVEGTGDFNGDGNCDILWRRSDGFVSMWQMDGHQILLNRGIMPVGTAWQIEGTGDFNGDGNSDILWRRNDGYVSMWQMDGHQILLNQGIRQVGTDWHVEGTGDFNGDGNHDILWRQNGGQVALWQMDGHQILVDSPVGQVSTDWDIVV